MCLYADDRMRFVPYVCNSFQGFENGKWLRVVVGAVLPHPQGGIVIYSLVRAPPGGHIVN